MMITSLLSFVTPSHAFQPGFILPTPELYFKPSPSHGVIDLQCQPQHFKFEVRALAMVY
jgi:hypothetical protein